MDRLGSDNREIGRPRNRLGHDNDEMGRHRLFRE